MNTYNETIDQKTAEIVFEEKDYGDRLGITYEFIDSTGHKWIQQNVAEFMLGVGYKSVERYCKDLNVKRERHKTKRYSYNFIKENDVEAIANHYDKALKRPWTEIPHTDENKKVLSKSDAQFVAEQHMAQAVTTYQSRISKLEDRNDKLNDDIKTANNETTKTKGREKNWQLLFILCLAVIGGGSFFVWDSLKEWETEKSQTIKKNSSLTQEVQQKTQIITSKDMEIRKLENELKDQEIEFLKTRAEKKSLEKFTLFEGLKLEGDTLK